jgi:signal transduction histidine kinase
LPKIFDRYVTFRADEGSSAASDGHQGLGLWIVKRNVE